MRKLIIAGVATAIVAAASPAYAADPEPPAEWRMPVGTKYLKNYKDGLDCWRWWKITKCQPKR